ncbi:FadR/GntR family transcriptional regulator [Kitasatospora sp. NPDC127111]|uniref:FadR/GntR family transcriptional regulator n=1 Tax=Kitasatospora sp. NPDC127111 TaxID=3345363 RepID=UPI0036261AB7
MVEVQAARLAAVRRDEADIAALDRALTTRREAGSADDAQFVDADIALHTAVVAAAHNPVPSDLFPRSSPPSSGSVWWGCWGCWGRARAIRHPATRRTPSWWRPCSGGRGGRGAGAGGRVGGDQGTAAHGLTDTPGPQGRGIPPEPGASRRRGRFGGRA